MDPFTAAMLGAGLGIGAQSLFGKKSKKYKPPPMPKLSEQGQFAQTQLYNVAQRAMAGGGMLPFNRFQGMRPAYREAYAQTKPMLASFLNRMVPRADIKVRGYADEMLKRGYYGGLQDLREQERLAPFEEQQEGMNLAAQLLGEEKRLGVNIMDIYNQGQFQLSQMPTFGSQLGSGLGGAAGTLAAAQYEANAAQRFAQLMSGRY